MNGWVERRAGERENGKEHDRIIGTGAEDLWKSLRQSVMAAAKQYADRFPPQVEPHDFIQTSPSDGFDEVWVEVMTNHHMLVPSQRPRSKRKVTITFDRKQWIISSRYTSQRESIELAIGVDDGAACFFHEGQRISVEKATEIILSPALFPDLIP